MNPPFLLTELAISLLKYEILLDLLSVLCFASSAACSKAFLSCATLSAASIWAWNISPCLRAFLGFAILRAK